MRQGTGVRSADVGAEVVRPYEPPRVEKLGSLRDQIRRDLGNDAARKPHIALNGGCTVAVCQSAAV